MPKSRLDLFLVEAGFFSTRSQSQSAILAGLVFVDGVLVDKAGAPVKPDSRVEVRGKTCPYASRGGLKLEKALEEFKISPAEKICLDIGASTGGFTDCLLQKGAGLVYAVDVGYGQIDLKLRRDERVILLERTNARYLKLSDLEKAAAAAGKKFGGPAELVVMDVSFISILKIFSVFDEITTADAKIISLIKPQFEAGRTEVEKGGLVKKPEIHEKVIEKIIAEAEKMGFGLQGLTFSPITGARGNIEYFGLWSKSPGSSKIDIQEVIARSGATKQSNQQRLLLPPKAGSQ